MALLCWGIAGSAKTLSVCSSCDCELIKDAIASVNPGDTILILPGVYQEGNIIIDKSLTLLGQDYPIIDGKGETEILSIIADHVSIIGLQIEHVGHSYLEDRAGIRVKESKHFVIENNRLMDTFFGIYLERADSGRIVSNFLQGLAEEEMSSGNAIHLWYSKYILIEDNEISHHRDGIYFEFVDHSKVLHNNSHHNLRYGLHFMFSNYDTYQYNRFQENGAGVAVMFSKHIHLSENDFVANWGRASYGLLLKEIYDAEIIHNRFTKNTLGIHIEGCTRILYQGNLFSQNGWAIRMAGGCLDNEISQNNFEGNTFDLALHSHIGNNTFDGNYWSDYSGYDLERDGVGDVPHNPVKLFSYVINQSPEAIVLLRSTFIDLLNFSEKVSPSIGPEGPKDHRPAMQAFEFTSTTTTHDFH